MLIYLVIAYDILPIEFVVDVSFFGSVVPLFALFLKEAIEDV